MPMRHRMNMRWGLGKLPQWPSPGTPRHWQRSLRREVNLEEASLERRALQVVASPNGPFCVGGVYEGVIALDVDFAYVTVRREEVSELRTSEPQS